MTTSRLGARRSFGAALLAVGLVALAPNAVPAGAAPSSRRPDAALFGEAQRVEATLRQSPRRQAKRAEWEKAVLAYRRVVARYPRSGYSDNALLAAGNLYREMARRWKSTRYGDDAKRAYRMLVAEYPSSSLGDDALWAVVDMSRGSRERLPEAARAYLEAFPDGRRSREVKSLLRRRAPAAPLPKAPPPGLAAVFDLRFWTGEASTRVVIDLARKVSLQSDRVSGPDRLWVDLAGTRLHPNLARRAFPVGDGLLRQVRIAQNREDVVRVVLDFQQVSDYSILYLEDPIRLVIDVRGPAQPPRMTAEGGGAPEAAPLRSRPLDGMVPPDPGAPPSATPGAGPAQVAAAVSPPAGPPAAPPPPEPPAANRAGSYSLARQLGLGARRIVIDAGHGGHDPGTTGPGGLQEKDLVLDVALRLERLVRGELGAEVLLTRANDVFVPLEERTGIANSREADLFLSIHANASRNPRARGIETYFLNFARSPHAEAVAARENAISAATLKDLQQLVTAITRNSKIVESRDFASSVQESMVRALREQHHVEDRGVHTAPFYVLIGANMPAVLAEIAFVTNPEDERRLRKPDYRELLARSLLHGVRAYLEALNRTQLRQLTGAPDRSRVAEAGTDR